MSNGTDRETPAVSALASGTEAGERRDEHLRLVLEAAGAGTWEVDLRTSEAEVSREQLALFGLPSGTPFGFAEWIARVYPEDRDRVRDEARAAHDAGAPYASELRIVRADTGEVRWIQACGRRMGGADGRALNFVGVNLDITAAKRAEAELREQRAEMHERGMADDELIADDERERFAGTSAGTGTTDTGTGTTDTGTRTPGAAGPGAGVAAGTGDGTEGRTGDRTGTDDAGRPGGDYEQGRADERAARFSRTDDNADDRPGSRRA